MKKIDFSTNNLAWLIDPDKISFSNLESTCKKAEKIGFNTILIGGSLVFYDIDQLIRTLKKYISIPIYLFPGSVFQLSKKADGILFTSLLSGRNPEYLIGQQVIAAPLLKQTTLDVVSTAYILIENGRTTSVEYISNTKPIPADKTDIVLATCFAAEYLGFRCIYLEAGSGALNPVPLELVKTIAAKVSIPIIVGGGIKQYQQVEAYFKAGANTVVVGTALETDTFEK